MLSKVKIPDHWRAADVDMRDVEREINRLVLDEIVESDLFPDTLRAIDLARRGKFFDEFRVQIVGVVQFGRTGRYINYDWWNIVKSSEESVFVAWNCNKEGGYDQQQGA